jgi:protein-S-isoprenylcysteine O-methyltransferase Ste14
MDQSSRWSMILIGLLVQAVFLTISVLGWGDWRSFFADPPRLAMILLSLVLTVVALASGVNFSTGRRADLQDTWIFAPLVIGSVLLCWLLPFADRRDLLTFDGDAVRYTGLALLAVGGVLRVGPVLVLGRRFSAFVAIQEGHELVTDGWYRVIRHPSYLGALLLFIGWMLLFRSLLAFFVLPIAIWIVVSRMDAEEALLASEFGDAYAAYRRRTWRLIPLIY